MGYPHVLPDLGYAYDALEPHIDARTMEIHHSKHHNAYTANLNNALESHPGLHGYSGEQLLRGLAALPAEVRTAVRNNGGGFENHSLFWRTLAPGGSGAPPGDLASAIDGTFGGVDALKSAINAAGATRFGSGWAWLSVDAFGSLVVSSTANQDSPLSSGSTPILGVDVWEHAYYLRYQNRRPEYLAAFWNVVNWDVVGANYAAAAGGWIRGA
ncbi:MAG: superoxide dismutase [Gammaproteobacteria bacterium]|nr:superoxide dismutase [Gammaproteobacteria bacterium]